MCSVGSRRSSSRDKDGDDFTLIPPRFRGTNPRFPQSSRFLCPLGGRDHGSLGLGWTGSFDAVLLRDQAPVQQPLGRRHPGCDLAGPPGGSSAALGGAVLVAIPVLIRLVADQRRLESHDKFHLQEGEAGLP